MHRAYATFSTKIGATNEPVVILPQTAQFAELAASNDGPETCATDSWQRELNQSSGTPDRRRAVEAACPIVSAWEAQIAASTSSFPLISDARQFLVPTRRELEETALLIGYEEASVRAAVLIESRARLGGPAFENQAREFDRRHSDAVRELFTDDKPSWGTRADKAIARLGWSLPRDSADYHYFVRTLAGVDQTFLPALSRLWRVAAASSSQASRLPNLPLPASKKRSPVNASSICSTCIRCNGLGKVSSGKIQSVRAVSLSASFPVLKTLATLPRPTVRVD